MDQFLISEKDEKILKKAHAKMNRQKGKHDFIKRYMKASNAATGSERDPNSNVASKNLGTLNSEIYKEDAIWLHRQMMYEKIEELYGKEQADKYILQLNKHEIYTNDETNPVFPYCASITMYPFLFNGLKGLGGSTDAPTNLDSYCGSFINLVFAVSGQLAGACSTPEFLMYMDYFIRKDYGDEYYKHSDDIVDMSKRQRSIRKVIEDHFQQIIYSVNQPASARGNQACFLNIAYFDKPYFDGIFGEFYFPDGSTPIWESLSWLQKLFMNWFNEERRRKPITFPVETLNLLNDGKIYIDKEWADFSAEMWSKGHSFFKYTSDSVDSLASCCRLRNEFVDNVFSYTLGAGALNTGSKCVITININRLVQDAVKLGVDISEHVSNRADDVRKYLIARNEIIMDYHKAGLAILYDAGFVTPEKCFLTIGLNGVLESAEFLGIEISPNEEYSKHCERIFKPIFDGNKAARTDKLMFNTELIPAENVGVKHASWDKEDGYFVPRDCYNSYFYIVESDKYTYADKLKLHGDEYVKYLDGGSANHTGFDEHLTKDQYRFIMDLDIKYGCNYRTFNIPNTLCNECGHISKENLKVCSKCGSEDVDYLTRVIGYLVRVSKMSEARQKEANQRYYEKV